MPSKAREPLLSPAEIEAILETSQAARHRGLKSEPETIDILASDRLIQQMLPALTVGYVRLSATLRKVLTSTLRMKVEVRDEAPEIITGRGLTRVTENAACLLGLRTHVLGRDCGQSVLILDPVLAYRIIERVFGGGSGGETTIAERAPTALEQRMILRTLTPVIDALNRTLEPANSFRFMGSRVESTLDLIPGFTPDITVLHIGFTVKLGDEMASMSLALPTSALSPLRPLLCAPLGESTESNNELGQFIPRVPISVAVELGRATMTLRDVVNLQVGTVIPLDKHPQDELPVQVGGVIKFHGMPVHDDGAIAIEITRKHA